MGASVITRRIMAWIQNWLHPQDARRFDAVLAADVEAKERAGQAAGALAQTARERGRDAKDVQNEIRRTIRQHSDAANPLGGTTSDVRSLVETALARVQPRPGQKG
ncbi:hypothetical protein SB2_11940 [Methylobacterium radiotolerans]|nr:hypothetical protein SB3_11135 [Methylobacterium radiotolerans]KTS48001.1 hypothetical protein SB2_11940 [Methylobacterium radiotolerans]